jgi:hypothetical protein
MAVFRVLGNETVVCMYQEAAKIACLEARKMLGDDLGSPMAVFSREADRCVDRLLHVVVEHLAMVKELIAPILAMVHKDQKTWAPQTARDEQLHLTSLFPFPAPI